MKRVILFLLMVLIVSACYSQNTMDHANEPAPALGDYLYLVKGGTTDRNTSKQQFQQNLFDSLVDVRAAMIIQQGEIDDNNDSIVSNEAGIADNVLSIDSLQTGVFNVFNFGADTTGVAESSTAINTAVNLADIRGGGTVIIPLGTYYITTPITMRSYVHIKADQGAKFIFDSDYSGSMYTTDTLSPTDEVYKILYKSKISGGIYGNTPSDRLWNFLDFKFNDGDSCYAYFNTIENVHMEYCNYGLNLESLQDGNINGNTFKNISMWRPRSGVRTRESASSTGLGNNTFDNINIQTSSSYTDFALDSITGDFNTWTNIHIYDVSAPTYSAYLTSTCTYNSFEGGTLYEARWIDDGTNNSYGAGQFRPINGYEVLLSTAITDTILATYTQRSSMITYTGSVADTVETIEGGNSGQILLLQGRSNSNTLTVSEGGNIELNGGTDIVLGLWDLVVLVYSPYSSKWLQTAPASDN